MQRYYVLQPRLKSLGSGLLMFLAGAGIAATKVADWIDGGRSFDLLDVVGVVVLVVVAAVGVKSIAATIAMFRWCRDDMPSVMMDDDSITVPGRPRCPVPYRFAFAKIVAVRHEWQPRSGDSFLTLDDGRESRVLVMSQLGKAQLLEIATILQAHVPAKLWK
jgi:hypothetical protein